MPNTKKYLSIAGLEHYDDKIKKHISDADAATLQSAKDYADSLASNYDAAGSAASAESAAKAHAESKVNELKTYVGTIPNGEDGNPIAASVVAYVDKKTEGIATDAALSELTARVGQAETDIDNIEKDYLKAADKTELQGNIDAANAAAGAAQAQADKGVADAAAAKAAADAAQGTADAAVAAVATEESRAKGVEEGLEARLAAVEDDHLNAADKKALEDSIAANASAITALTDGFDAEKVDGVKDLIKYVEDHGPEVTGMKEDIGENAAAIAAEAQTARAAEQANATAAANAQAKAEEAVAAVETEKGRAEGVEQGLDTRLQAVEAKFGEGDGNVEDMIATAKQEAIDAAALDATSKANTAESNAKGYTDGEIDKVEATIAEMQAASATHALASDLTALAGRVTTAEGEIDTLQSEMDAVEALAAANKTAHEANAAAIALKADQSALDAAVARITANEAEIASFAAIENSEIDAMFA